MVELRCGRFSRRLEPFLALGLFRTIFVFQQPYKRHIRTQISYWVLVMIAFFVKLFTLG